MQKLSTFPQFYAKLSTFHICKIYFCREISLNKVQKHKQNVDYLPKSPSKKLHFSCYATFCISQNFFSFSVTAIIIKINNAIIKHCIFFVPIIYANRMHFLSRLVKKHNLDGIAFNCY